MNHKLFQILCLIACAALTGCGTVTNGYIAAAEKNIAVNTVQSEVNQVNAATFTICQTPVYVLPYLLASQRNGIKSLCVPTDANVEASNIINVAAAPVAVPAN